MKETKTEGRDSGFVDEPENGLWNEASGFERLHSMAMSTIWTAAADGRRRVYKSLSEAVKTNPVYQRLLRKEYGIMSRLSHPGVVSSISLRSHEGIGEAIEMEWIDGVTLDRWMADNEDRASRRRVMNQLLEAVGYIHSKGIVHRDLKPTNIMVTHDGMFIKIIDFGLADSRSHTELKNPAGTEEYMSERQKQAFEPSVADDLFALRRIAGEMFPNLQKWAMRQSDATDAEMFGRRLRKRLSRRRRLTIIGVITAFTGILAAATFIGFSKMQTRQRNELAQQASDLREQISEIENAHQSNLSILNDSIARLTAQATADRRMTDSLTAESSRLNEAIHNGAKRREMVEAIISRLESQLSKIWSTEETEKATKAAESYQLIRDYVAKNPDRLTESELATVETAFQQKHYQLYTK